MLLADVVVGQRVVRNHRYNFGVIPEGELGTIQSTDVFNNTIEVVMDNPIYNLGGRYSSLSVKKLDVVEQVEGDAS